MRGGWLDFRCHSAQFGQTTASGGVGGREKDGRNDNGQDGEILRRRSSPHAQGNSRELVSVYPQHLHARCYIICIPNACAPSLNSFTHSPFFHNLILQTYFSINRDSLCSYWASLGDCETNRQYMVDICPAACQLCWLAGTDILH